MRCTQVYVARGIFYLLNTNFHYVICEENLMKKAQCRNFANEVYRWYSAMSKYFETSLFRKFNHKLLYMLDNLVVPS